MRNLILGLAVTALVVAPEALRDNEEVRELHILMVIDSDRNLGNSVRADQKHMRQLIESTIPPARRSLTVLSGKQATRERIIAHYRSLSAGPEDGLVIYFSGHGATDAGKGHFIQLQGSPSSLLRSDLRAAM